MTAFKLLIWCIRVYVVLLTIISAIAITNTVEPQNYGFIFANWVFLTFIYLFCESTLNQSNNVNLPINQAQ